MIFVYEERIFVIAVFDRLPALKIDYGLKLLLEIYIYRLLQRLEAATASFGFFQAEMRPHQDAGLCPQKLHVTRNRLRFPVLAEDFAVNLILPGSADAFLDKTSYVEKHGKP